MIWSALRWVVGTGQALWEGIGALRGLVRGARRGTLPLDESAPIPLRQRDEIRPPPPRSSRYD